MTAREYLSQGYLLEQRIACDMRRAEAARALAASIPESWKVRDRVCTSAAGEAPFVRTLERVYAMERKINAELNLLVSLKEQMDGVIRSVQGEELRILLTCRYMEHRSWPEIADILNICLSTTRVWHKTALSGVVLPDDPIDIRESFHI